MEDVAVVGNTIFKLISRDWIRGSAQYKSGTGKGQKVVCSEQGNEPSGLVPQNAAVKFLLS